jgi:hypothetical protein
MVRFVRKCCTVDLFFGRSCQHRGNVNSDVARSYTQLYSYVVLCVGDPFVSMDTELIKESQLVTVCHVLFERL